MGPRRRQSNAKGKALNALVYADLLSPQLVDKLIKIIEDDLKFKQPKKKIFRSGEMNYED